MNTNIDMDFNDLRKKDGFLGEQMIVLPTESFTPYIEHPLVRRLYLTDIGYFPQAAHHYRTRPNGADQYIYFYCMEGSGLIELDGKKYELHKNEAFVIPQGQAHTYYAAEENPWSLLWVHFKGEDVQHYPLEEKQIIHFDDELASNRIFYLFNMLFRVLDKPYTLGNFIYISQMLSLLLSETYYRNSHAAPISAQDRNVTAIIRFMYQHLDQSLTMDDLQKTFGYSKSYLSMIFQNSTHHSPMNFYTRLKMDEACKLLRSTNLRIYEVAQKLGYRDPYYFSRIFKKTVGISPQEYKDNDYVADVQN